MATPEPETVPISAEEATQTFPGPPRVPPNSADRDLVEEADDAGLLHEGAEQDEEEDVGRRDGGRRAVDALRPEAHVLHDLLEIVAAMVERRGQQVADQAISEEASRHDRQSRPEHVPDEQEERDGRDDADDDVRRRSGRRPG